MTFGLIDILTYFVCILLLKCQRLLFHLQPEIDPGQANSSIINAIYATNHLIVLKLQILIRDLNSANLAIANPSQE
jgi:hypothetical protein